MSRELIKSNLQKAQVGAACHQKCLKVLENHYSQTDFAEFFEVFYFYLKKIFRTEITVHNAFVERALDFCAQFVTLIYYKQDDDDNFLAEIIKEALKYHNLVPVKARYHSCRFITLILEYIKKDTQLDNEVCDLVQEAMLERIIDVKASIRVQAVMALTRLQDPHNPDCLVIHSYLVSIHEINADVRREIVKRIAPTTATIPKVKDRIRDTDFNVRLSAFQRCADMGPRCFKIIDRQFILTCGFSETNVAVKKIFLEYLLPKWLTSYDGDFLGFLSAIKLDADENDIQNSAEISVDLLEVFFKTCPINDIIGALKVGDDKLIPINELTSEDILFWSILTNYLRNVDIGDDYLDQIIPELTAFCNYIENVIKLKSSKAMDDWELLDYQYILMNLFDIAEKYDIADEVGRKTLQNLIVSSLQNHRFNTKLLHKLVAILDKLISNVDTFTNEICQIISDIREPMMFEKMSDEKLQQQEFLMAGIRVKLNILNENKQQAIDDKDFVKAQMYENELAENLRRIEDIKKQFEPGKVRSSSSNDPDTICRCVDILASMLMLPSIKFMSPALRSCKDEFLMPLLTSANCEINWRVLRCLVLYCVIDKPTADENGKVVALPIATYRTIPNYNKNALMVCVAAMSDLLRIYGAELFGVAASSTSSGPNVTRRKLYNEDMDDIDINSVADEYNFSVENIIETILDMMDDEDEEIRDISVQAILKLVVNGFPVTPQLISRILLKWYNPMSGFADENLPLKQNERRKLNYDTKLQQKLGLLIEEYVGRVKDSRQYIEKAVIPTISSLVNAPRNSPLADVDVDNVLKFLSQLTNSSTGVVHLHKALAHALLLEIGNKPDGAYVSCLARMLSYLEVPEDDRTCIKELVTSAQLLYEDEKFAKPNNNIKKFIDNLKVLLRNLEVIAETVVEETVENNDHEDTENNTVDDSNPNIPNGESTRYTLGTKEDFVPVNTGVKRKKQRGRPSKNASLLQPINENKSFESGSADDDDLAIKTPTTSPTNSSNVSTKSQTRNTTIISETSSDSEAPSSTRKSGRKKKNNKDSPNKTQVELIEDDIVSSTTGVKRKKKRGRPSKNETLLHTICEKSIEPMGVLEEDLTIQTPTTSPSSSSNKSSRSSTRKNVVISETSSDSESQSPLRKSTRKIKKKDMKEYVQ